LSEQRGESDERRGIGGGWSSQHGRRTAAAQAGFFLPYLREGMTILDCGCGPGSITLGLAAAVAPGDVIGVDVDARRIAEAKALAIDAGTSNVTFQLADIYQLPFPDDYFDGVYEHATLEHLDDPRAAIQEIRRVLKPGAVFGASDRMIMAAIHAPEWPDDEGLLREHLELVRRYRKSTGSDLNFGLRLFGLLQELGFVDVWGSVSPEFYSEYGNKRSAIDSAIARVRTTPFGDFAIRECGAERLEQQIAAWNRLAESPRAWFCEFNGESVGTKAR
jgi:SAM-dependent methyltransferase